MSKHTPGPWFVAKETDLQESDGNVVVSPNGWEIRPDGYQKLGDEMADLRLIAAAPDLLEILERAVRRLEIAHANGDTIMREWIIDARAAIAKATG